MRFTRRAGAKDTIRLFISIKAKISSFSWGTGRMKSYGRTAYSDVQGSRIRLIQFEAAKDGENPCLS